MIYLYEYLIFFGKIKSYKYLLLMYVRSFDWLQVILAQPIKRSLQYYQQLHVAFSCRYSWYQFFYHFSSRYRAWSKVHTGIANAWISQQWLKVGSQLNMHFTRQNSELFKNFKIFYVWINQSKVMMQ